MTKIWILGALVFFNNTFACYNLFSNHPFLIEKLLVTYRQNSPANYSFSQQNFSGVEGRDVYNPSGIFEANIDGKREQIIAARVESRNSETDSQVMFFKKQERHWHLIQSAPVFKMQDPFVSFVNDEIILGGVEIKEDQDGQLNYRTSFYRGSDLFNLTHFTDGPWRMKDIRLTKLPNGKIVVATRPQGEIGGRGKIGITIINNLDELNAENINKAIVIESLFDESEWGGANELVSLKDNKVGVLGHIAQFDSNNKRHYYPVSFAIDLKNNSYTTPKILVERFNLESGLEGESKRSDLVDVIFSGGSTKPNRNGEITLSLGAGDAETHLISIPDPFSGLRL